MSGQMQLAAAIIAISISLGGCSAFAPRADPSSFYILGTQEGVAVDKSRPVIKPILLWAWVLLNGPITSTANNRHSHFDESIELFRE